MGKHSTKTRVCAGIDTGKASLFYAVAGTDVSGRCDNAPEGHARLVEAFRAAGVDRVGIESTGSYHFEIVDELREAGFEVVVLQPVQVKAYAKFKLKRAKSDPIDAVLIAHCVAAIDDPRGTPDPRFAPLAEHLTFIEQIDEDLVRAKTRRDRYRDPRLSQSIEDEIKRLQALKRAELRLLLAAVRADKELARRLELLVSIEGIGERTAVALVIRMPELGHMTREEAASLIGAAPFVHDSGRFKGQRRTGGGRARARTSLFAAAQVAARLWNPALIAHYDRLTKAGKPHKVAIIACVRKMIIFANAVLARGEPWKKRLPTRPAA